MNCWNIWCFWYGNHHHDPSGDILFLSQLSKSSIILLPFSSVKYLAVFDGATTTTLCTHCMLPKVPFPFPMSVLVVLQCVEKCNLFHFKKLHCSSFSCISRYFKRSKIKWQRRNINEKKRSGEAICVMRLNHKVLQFVHSFSFLLLLPSYNTTYPFPVTISLVTTFCAFSFFFLNVTILFSLRNIPTHTKRRPINIWTYVCIQKLVQHNK